MALRTTSEDEAEAQLYEVLADLEEMEVSNFGLLFHIDSTIVIDINHSFLSPY